MKDDGSGLIGNVICLILDSFLPRKSTVQFTWAVHLDFWGESITIVRIDGREALSSVGRI